MADKPHNYDEELANLMNALAESTLEMSDEEVLAEIREEGEEPEKVAEEVRGVLKGATKSYRQRRLIEAQKRYDERIADLGGKKYSLPDSIEKQRNLLMGVLANNPGMRSSLLTAQNRDFTDLPDSEVTSYLKQLFDLGALDDILAREGGE